VASAGKARQVPDQLMTTIMEKTFLIFFTGARISYSRYNKKERRTAKQLQEHRSLYKAPDSSKDLVKANTKKAPQKQGKLKFQMGVQTTMPNNSPKCPPRRRTRSGRIVQKPDAFECTDVKLPKTKWRRIDFNDLSDSSNNTSINSQVRMSSTYSSKSKVSISSTFSSIVKNKNKFDITSQGDSSLTVRQSF